MNIPEIDRGTFAFYKDRLSLLARIEHLEKMVRFNRQTPIGNLGELESVQATLAELRKRLRTLDRN
jgi:hypothetical protein